MEFITILFLLIAAHFVCDYPLQGDFIANNKARLIKGSYNPIWYHCLTAHCFIHTAAVFLITQNIWLALLMLISHFAIDFAKCSGKLTFNQDQAWHLFVVVLIAAISGI